MWGKRNMIIASVVIAVVISASVGFYEIGFGQGNSFGYLNGLSQGRSSVIVQMQTQIHLKPNSTDLFFPPDYLLPNNVTLQYSFSINYPNSQNETVQMLVYGVGSSGSPQLLFNTGYHYNASGVVPLSTKNGSIAFDILFKANPNNSMSIDLDFLSPLMFLFN